MIGIEKFSSHFKGYEKQYAYCGVRYIITNQSQKFRAST
jgi:hypothetical protein